MDSKICSVIILTVSKLYLLFISNMYIPAFPRVLTLFTLYDHIIKGSSFTNYRYYRKFAITKITDLPEKEKLSLISVIFFFLYIITITGITGFIGFGIIHFPISGNEKILQ